MYVQQTARKKREPAATRWEGIAMIAEVARISRILLLPGKAYTIKLQCFTYQGTENVLLSAGFG